MPPKRKSAKAAPPLVSAQLFFAVQSAMDQGWSVNAIAKAAGVPQSTLQEWIGGTRDSISQKTSNALCSWLGMQLTEPTIPGRGE